MTAQDFFAKMKTAPDGFGDMKQGIFGYHDETGCYLSDGMERVVEVDYVLYREVDSAFGVVYDAEEATSDELDELRSEAGLA